MRCKKAQILISASLDGELSRRESQALERHISACSECAMVKADFYALHGTMALWTEEEPSPWLAENFAYKLRQFEEDKERSTTITRKRSPRWVFGTATAGIAATLLAIGLLFHSQIMPPEPLEHKVTVEAPIVQTKPQPQSTISQASKPETAVARTPEASTESPAEVKPVSSPRQYAPTPRVHRRPAASRPIVRVAAPRPPHRGDYASRSESDLIETDKIIVAKLVEAGIAEEETTSAVTDNLGEAGLSMNETIERVRGSLRKAVDLIAFETPVNAADRINHNGGNTL